MNIEQIKQVVKNTLSEKRYYHSLCVMEKCVEYAQIYNIDIEKARQVGLVHDIAKEMPDDLKLEYAVSNGLLIDDVEKKHIGLLHAKIGADIAKKSFGFSDDMCKAIRLHTTGGKNMSLLDKVLYVADATGNDRSWEGIEDIRILVKTNIDDVVLYILNREITDRIKNQKMIHIDSIFARNELLSVKE